MAYFQSICFSINLYLEVGLVYKNLSKLIMVVEF